MNKWKVFREKVPEDMKPLWVVWERRADTDQCEEYLFQTGSDALDFVRRNIDAGTKTSSVVRWFSVPAKWYETADSYAVGRKSE
jgi:hypothetical protein